MIPNWPLILYLCICIIIENIIFVERVAGIFVIPFAADVVSGFWNSPVFFSNFSSRNTADITSLIRKKLVFPTHRNPFSKEAFNNNNVSRVASARARMTTPWHFHLNSPLYTEPRPAAAQKGKDSRRRVSSQKDPKVSGSLRVKGDVYM